MRFAVGHSAASYEQVEQAVEAGLCLAVHTFNGMPPLHHRSPGVLGAALSDERIYTELIADGVHLHPAVFKLAVRAKGVERVLLVSDAMRAAGLPDGNYDLGRQDIRVDGGVALTAAGKLAGSTLTLDAARAQCGPLWRAIVRPGGAHGHAHARRDAGAAGAERRTAGGRRCGYHAV